MSKAASHSGTGEALCCCEYENWKGERSHILACCCDCEAVDEAFDKLFKCERLSSGSLDKILITVSDRLRIPMFSGKGAIKLRPDAVIPMVVVPSCLCLATLHPVMTFLAFLLMPVTMAIFLSVYRRQNKQRRTIFFYSWAMTSVVSSYIVFQAFVVAFREVLLWEILLVFTMTVGIFRLLRRVRRDSGHNMKGEGSSKKSGAGSDGGGGHKRTHSNVTPQIVTNGALYDQVTGKEVSPDHQFYEGSGEGSNVSVLSPDSSAIQWVDSRTPQDMNRGVSYCDVCRMHKLPRVGHCPRCEVCITGRDHHCVWIDCCVGASNHRYFLAAMILFIVTGLYGVHLTMTTICTPIMLFDWFLMPNDCRWLYIDFLTSICFVTAIYVCLVTSLVSFGLLMQLMLISQNITGQEFVLARRLGMTRFFFLVPDNPHNRGFLRNWTDFLFLESRDGATKLPL